MNEDIIVDELHQFCGDCTDLKDCIIRKYVCKMEQIRIDSISEMREEERKFEHIADTMCDDMFYNACLHP